MNPMNEQTEALAILHYEDGTTEQAYVPIVIDDSAEVITIRREDRSSEIPLIGLKAIFFLRADGASSDEEEKTHQQAEGGVLNVEFQDGEVIRGSSDDYLPQRRGFFLFPLDRSKNERIFVFNSAVSSIEIEKF